jgi:hypothetical protein
MLLLPFEERWLSALRLVGPKSFKKKRQDDNMKSKESKRDASVFRVGLVY